MDPSAPKYTYLQWMLKQYTKNDVKDAKRIADAIHTFIRWDRDTNKFAEADIGKYSVEQIEQLSKQGSVAHEQVYSKDGWRIFHIEDFETMCAVGKRRWCVSWQEADHWQSYMSKHPDGELYLIEGPAAKAPYLAFIANDQLIEIKDNGNAAIPDDAEVYTVMLDWNPDWEDLLSSQKMIDEIMLVWSVDDSRDLGDVIQLPGGELCDFGTRDSWFYVNGTWASSLNHVMQSELENMSESALADAYRYKDGDSTRRNARESAQDYILQYARDVYDMRIEGAWNEDSLSEFAQIISDTLRPGREFVRTANSIIEAFPELPMLDTDDLENLRMFCAARQVREAMSIPELKEGIQEWFDGRSE
jgi:hypothetical protein